MGIRIVTSVVVAVGVLGSAGCGGGKGRRSGDNSLNVAILERADSEAGSGSRMAAGTRILVRTEAPVSTQALAAGDRVSGRLSETVEQSGQVLAAAGTEAVVRVVDTESSGLTLRLSQLRLSPARHMEVLSQAVTVKRGEIPAGSVLAFQLQSPAEIPR